MKKRLAEAETKISSQSAECERLKTELQDEQEKTSYLMDEFKTVLKTLYPITWKDSPNKSVTEIEKWSFQNLKENLYEWRNDYSKDIKNTLTKRLEKRGKTHRHYRMLKKHFRSSCKTRICESVFFVGQRKG